MGALSAIFSTGLVVAGTAWYFYYAAPRVSRGGAVYHWFARLGEQRYAGLDRELRGILKEKGLRAEDPFDEIVARSHVIDARAGTSFESIAADAAELLQGPTGEEASALRRAFLEGTRIGATPVTHGVALPHMKIMGLEHPAMVLVRSHSGIHITSNDPITDHVQEQQVHALFFLVSNEDNPGQHLRILAQIAGRVDDDGFAEEWLAAGDEQDLQEVVLRDDRFLILPVRITTGAKGLIDRRIRDIWLPKGALIALVRRDGNVSVPDGSTEVFEGDRLTIIGSPASLEEIRRRYLRTAS